MLNTNLNGSEFGFRRTIETLEGFWGLLCEVHPSIDDLRSETSSFGAQRGSPVSIFNDNDPPLPIGDKFKHLNKPPVTVK